MHPQPSDQWTNMAPHRHVSALVYIKWIHLSWLHFSTTQNPVSRSFLLRFNFLKTFYYHCLFFFCRGLRKTRSLDLSRVRRHFQKKSGRQTDKQFFFKKTFEIAIYATKFLSTIQKHKKLFRKPLKQFCDGPTDRRTDGPTEKWLIELRVRN